MSSPRRPLLQWLSWIPSLSLRRNRAAVNQESIIASSSPHNDDTRSNLSHQRAERDPNSIRSRNWRGSVLAHGSRSTVAAAFLSDDALTSAVRYPNRMRPDTDLTKPLITAIHSYVPPPNLTRTKESRRSDFNGLAVLSAGGAVGVPGLSGGPSGLTTPAISSANPSARGSFDGAPPLNYLSSLRKARNSTLPGASSKMTRELGSLPNKPPCSSLQPLYFDALSDSAFSPLAQGVQSTSRGLGGRGGPSGNSASGDGLGSMAGSVRGGSKWRRNSSRLNISDTTSRKVDSLYDDWEAATALNTWRCFYLIKRAYKKYAFSSKSGLEVSMVTLRAVSRRTLRVLSQSMRYLRYCVE